MGWVRMNCMKDWIVADPEHLGGSPRVRGTRISVALILESLAAGMSAPKKSSTLNGLNQIYRADIRCCEWIEPIQGSWIFGFNDPR